VYISREATQRISDFVNDDSNLLGSQSVSLAAFAIGEAVCFLTSGKLAALCGLIVAAMLTEQLSRIDVAAKQDACLQGRLSVSLFVQLTKLVEDGVGETEEDNAEKQGLHTMDIPGIAWSVDNGKHCFDG
jgi:hypothetical protein